MTSLISVKRATGHSLTEAEQGPKPPKRRFKVGSLPYRKVFNHDKKTGLVKMYIVITADIRGYPFF
jgi:hypothetical protein